MFNLILILIIVGIIALHYLLPSVCPEYLECAFGIITYDIYAITELILILASVILLFRIRKVLKEKVSNNN